MTSMTSHTLSPTPTKHTSHPQARQKLLFTPTSSQQANGPSLHDGSNASATPVQNSLSAVAEISPQMIGMESMFVCVVCVFFLDTCSRMSVCVFLLSCFLFNLLNALCVCVTDLHPLQRALLLQQQQQQVSVQLFQHIMFHVQHTHTHTTHNITLHPKATVPEIPAGRSTPGTPLGGGATPLSQAVTPPISALPHHLVSHPSSPFSNSPSHTPFTTPPPGVHVVTPTIVPTPYTPQVATYMY